MATKRPKPVVLCVLDGFGVAPDYDGNAITRAKKPHLDALLRAYPAMTLAAAGLEVGLARGEMGNSEVGHLNIGAGRVFYQNRPRIDQAMLSGAFFENPAFLRATEHVKQHGSRLHLLGLVSSGGIHSHQEHLYALLELAKRAGVRDVFVHAILDGRDAIRDSGKGFIAALEQRMKKLGIGVIASLSGRYYALDRDNRWDRVEKAYRAMVLGEGEHARAAQQAIVASYAKSVFDEEFIPTVITRGEQPVGSITDGDAVIFFNFRADRARQLTHALVDPSFTGFKRAALQQVVVATMMEYEQGLVEHVAFPSEDIPTCLAKVWSEAKLKQLHIAETEKYAHVTFFFNGMREQEYPGEDRVLIPSPKVATYDEQPEMSAPKLTDRLLKELALGAYDVAVVNFANPDMVGHTGKFAPTVVAVEAVDACIGRIADAVIESGGVLVITADHGNAEIVKKLDTGSIDKEHETNPVPLLVCGKQFAGQTNQELQSLEFDLSLLTPAGILADVAPTLLKIMGIKKPSSMTGQSLI
ncbi:MAG: 2,3-bisphosphoglycerate-independent phosphoglycerate mutase [bacterium]|nr:2,3-bisphosphoglycerate-independent phosphoglycerate mutase [bacterium]